LFVERLKEEFLPADFDHRVAEEIRHTKQQENETFQEFCVRIELVFMKRLRQMTEEEKVEHIKHNMLKIYKTPDVARLRTINDLRDACRFVTAFTIVSRIRSQKLRNRRRIDHHGSTPSRSMNRLMFTTSQLATTHRCMRSASRPPKIFKTKFAR
jgi:hypothetical protein